MKKVYGGDGGKSMEQLYRKYFQAMPCYLTVQNRDFRIIDANERFTEDFGNWNGRHCYQIYKNRSEKCEVCPVEETFWDGKSHSGEEHIKTLDGRETSVIVYTTPIRDESGEIQAVIEMSTDITNLQKRTSQFRESQRRYQQLFEEAPCYVSIQDQDLNIIETNRRFKDDFGSFLGCKCYAIYKHRNEACIECPVQLTFADGLVHSSEEVVTSRTGKQMNVLVYTSPIFDSKGLIKRVMELSTDITPLRELQSQLESIGLLISSVSHGLKGLLNGLDGGMYLVNTGMEKGDEKRLKRGWEMVQRNVERIRGQVLNILYYTKERRPSWETVSASELCGEIFNLMEAKATELDIELKHNFDPSTGEFEADPQAIRSLLMNLTENALDACRVDNTKSGHVVTLSTSGDNEKITFNISDNGIGMDQEAREKAFSLFFSSKGAKGTGLGLFISNKIAKAHGGQLSVDSELDKGTSFIVTLPRKRVIESQETNE